MTPFPCGLASWGQELFLRTHNSIFSIMDCLLWQAHTFSLAVFKLSHRSMKQEIRLRENLQLAEKPLGIWLFIDWHRLISILKWSFYQLNIPGTQKPLTKIILLVWVEIKHFIRKAALKFCFRVYVPVLCMRKTSFIDISETKCGR